VLDEASNPEDICPELIDLRDFLRPRKDEAKVIILESVLNAESLCARCHVIAGSRLSGSATSYLHVFYKYNVLNYKRLLLGDIDSESPEALKARRILEDEGLAIFPDIFHDILAGLGEPEQKLKDDWLCENCIDELMRQNFHPWLLRTRMPEVAPGGQSHAITS